MIVHAVDERTDGYLTRCGLTLPRLGTYWGPNPEMATCPACADEGKARVVEETLTKCAHINALRTRTLRHCFDCNTIVEMK